MSYKDRAKAEHGTQPTTSHNCPAHGCPNAAAVSFDGRWACYFHASQPAAKWPEVTEKIRAGWPATCNWNHPEKVAYEAEQAALRRAKLPPRRGPVLGPIIGMEQP